MSKNGINFDCIVCFVSDVEAGKDDSKGALPDDRLNLVVFGKALVVFLKLLLQIVKGTLANFHLEAKIIKHLFKKCDEPTQIKR